MKIAILYVATGRYIAFWEDFYKTCEEFFVTDAQKTYFVFTDAGKIYAQDNENVIKIHQEKLGWPYDTLMRFKMFLTQEEKLKEHDYIFFFNANMKFVKPVGHEVLPDEEHCGLVAGLHPGNYKRPIDEVPYCRNEKSLAYIPYGQGKYYVQGCLNGGTRDAYLQFCKTCMENTQKDLDNGVIAEVHDESHLNKYVLDKNILVLPCNYLYPVGCYYPEYSSLMDLWLFLELVKFAKNSNAKCFVTTKNLSKPIYYFEKNLFFKNSFTCLNASLYSQQSTIGSNSETTSIACFT